MKRYNKYFFKYLGFFKIVIFLPLFLLAAQWSGSPDENAPVCTASADQGANLYDKAIAYSGDGRAVIVWKDSRNEATGSDIYTQRVDITGEVYWAKDGIPVCNAPESQYTPKIIPDGQGGVIIAWLDLRNDVSNWDIYAQRVDSSGNMLWAENGVPVCIEEELQKNFRMISDGHGGAILAWEDERLAGTHTNLFAQRIDSIGEPVWAENGIVVCDTSRSAEPDLVSDGSGGALITWSDGRSPIGGTNYDIYVQHISATGSVLWAHNGVAVTRADYGQTNPRITSDMAGGGIIVWYDFRDSNGLYTQRVNNSGSMVWHTDGLAIDSTSGKEVEIMSDGSGGAFYFWSDRSFSTDSYDDLYGQHINASGSREWGIYGLPICDEANHQRYPRVVSDGSDGLIVTWHDYRNSDNTDSDIAAQRLASTGQKMWASEGVYISNHPASQGNPEIAGYDSAGAFVTWSDYRNYDTSGRDMYMQGIDMDGNLYDVPLSIKDYDEDHLPAKTELFQNYPNPFNPWTIIKYQLAINSDVDLSIYNALGQKVATLVSVKQSAGTYQIKWNAAGFASGIYYYKLSTNQGLSQTKKLLLMK